MRFLPRLLMLVSLAAPLAHAELLDDVHQRGALRIALEGTYPPFNFKQGGKLTGFETELGELLAAELAVKPEFVTTEWSGILAGLQSGKYDIALNQVSVNEQRRKVFDFSEPYTISSAQLIVRADETRQFKSLEDLKASSSASARAPTTPTWRSRWPASTCAPIRAPRNTCRTWPANASTRRSTTAC